MTLTDGSTHVLMNLPGDVEVVTLGPVHNRSHGAVERGNGSATPLCTPRILRDRVQAAVERLVEKSGVGHRRDGLPSPGY